MERPGSVQGPWDGHSVASGLSRPDGCAQCSGQRRRCSTGDREACPARDHRGRAQAARRIPIL